MRLNENGVSSSLSEFDKPLCLRIQCLSTSLHSDRENPWRGYAEEHSLVWGVRQLHDAVYTASPGNLCLRPLAWNVPRKKRHFATSRLVGMYLANTVSSCISVLEMHYSHFHTWWKFKLLSAFLVIGLVFDLQFFFQRTEWRKPIFAVPLFPW